MLLHTPASTETPKTRPVPIRYDADGWGPTVGISPTYSNLSKVHSFFSSVYFLYLWTALCPCRTLRHISSQLLRCTNTARVCNAGSNLRYEIHGYVQYRDNTKVEHKNIYSLTSRTCFEMIQDVHVELKYRIPTAKAAWNKKILNASKLGLNLKKKIVKCYIWSMALFGAETC